MIRGHEVWPGGWKDDFGEGLCVTVHSAANHMRKRNKGAFLLLADSGDFEPVQYEAVDFVKRNDAQFVDVAEPRTKS
jgi:hypothetical protein